MIYAQNKIIVCILCIAVLAGACNNTEHINKKINSSAINDIDTTLFNLDTTAIDSRIAFRFDTFFKKRNINCHLSGTYLVAKGNKIHINSIGERKKLNSEAIQNHDIFQIASVSKFITSLCIGKLMEEGLIKLKDTVQVYLPEFSYPNITIHQLLTHTSGLPEYTYLTDTGWLGDTLPKTNSNAAELLSNCGMAAYYAPGSHFDYCNSNYMLLAYIAEQVTGMTFSNVVDEYIKKPCNLDSMRIYNPTERNINDYPVNGMRGDHSFIPDHPLNHIVGDKSVFINVYELYKIYKAFVSNRIVSAKTKNLILKPHVKAKNNQYYGYGIRSTILDNGEAWSYHNGWWHGYRSYFWFNESKDQCIIVLTNRLKCGFLNTRDLVWLLEYDE